MKYSNEQIKGLLDGIYNGSITEYDLPEDLYFAVADYLKSGLYEGFGGTLVDFAGKDLALLKELRDNIYMFSAAKTEKQVIAISSMLVDEDGNKRSSREFNKLGAQIYEKWNNNYGRTEYNTAVAQATMAGKWNEIQKNKDLLPYLTYKTIGDACVICRPLDGMTAKVDDPIWSKIMPVNHFNCLCIVKQGEPTTVETPEEEKSSVVGGVLKEMDNIFKMNSGQDKIIFSNKHPYFQVEKKDISFAKENFNLPIPKTDKK